MRSPFSVGAIGATLWRERVLSFANSVIASARAAPRGRALFQDGHHFQIATLASLILLGQRSNIRRPDRGSGSHVTRCWRETDSNPRSPARRTYANTEITAART